MVNCVQKPSIAEALALRRAVTLYAELGLSSVILEGDSQVIVKATSGEEEVWANYGTIVEYRLLIRGYRNCQIRFVYREVNNITHKRSKLAFKFSKERVWIEECHIEILSNIQKERFCND